MAINVYSPFPSSEEAMGRSIIADKRYDDSSIPVLILDGLEVYVIRKVNV